MVLPFSRQRLWRLSMIKAAVGALSAPFTQLCDFVNLCMPLPGAYPDASESVSMGIISLTLSPPGYRSPPKAFITYCNWGHRTNPNVLTHSLCNTRLCCTFLQGSDSSCDPRYPCQRICMVLIFVRNNKVIGTRIDKKGFLKEFSAMNFANEFVVSGIFSMIKVAIWLAHFLKN